MHKFASIAFVYYSSFNLATHFGRIIRQSWTDNASDTNLIRPVEFNRVIRRI